MHRQQRQESGRNLTGYPSAGLSLSESNSNAVADYPSTSRYYSSCGSVWRVRSRVPSGSRVPPTGSGVSSGANGAYNSPSRCSRSTMSCPRLVSLLACSATLLLISSCIGLADAGILNGHPLGKRSFIDIQCKGIYDKSIFARLDRICEDCYNLFREPQLHQLCRKNCFTSDYFKGCLDVLLLQDEVEKIQTWIKQLHGAEPGV